jgi:hypothetical protein
VRHALKEPEGTKPEEPHRINTRRFVKSLTDIAAATKAAIYELDPRLRPKPRPIAGETKSQRQSVDSAMRCLERSIGHGAGPVLLKVEGGVNRADYTVQP